RCKCRGGRCPERRGGIEARGNARFQAVGKEGPLVKTFHGGHDRPRPDEAELPCPFDYRAGISWPRQDERSNIMVALGCHRDVEVYTDVWLARHEPHLFVASAT